MKKGIAVLLMALLAGGATFWVMRSHQLATPARATLRLDAMPELSWLRNDLHLTQAQFEKVRALHIAYRPHCAEMCQRITEARHRLATLAMDNREITPEYEAALKEHGDLQITCQQAMLRHLYQTAALLTPEQSQRYLQTVLPCALDFSPDAPGEGHHH